jgi:hypothetical protein
MKKILLIAAVLLLCVPAMAQDKPVVDWGCKIRELKDDVVTLDCRDKGDDGATFILDIPRSKWFPEWATIGEREFYYGVKDKDGRRFAIRTPPTHCDTEYSRPFGGNRISFQLCGKMFTDNR